MKRKLTALFLTFCLLCGFLPSSAAEFPQAIWKPLDAFNLAINAGNDAEILRLGKQLVDIMSKEPDSQLKTDFLSAKLGQVASSAEKLGLYDEACNFYRQYIPYGIAKGWNDGVLHAERKLLVLESYLQVYLETEEAAQPFFGAKHEPQSGVLYGMPYASDPRITEVNNETAGDIFTKDRSVYLIYLEFGDELEPLSRYTKYFEAAKANGKLILLAWNTHNSLSDIEKYDAYIRRTIDTLESIGVKVLLRFGAEMNVAPNGDNKEAYIKSFRYVADLAKQKQNIGMVWSPGDIGAVDRPYGDYYPGNDYVDWVGVSLYTSKYFLGKKDHGTDTDVANTIFITDEYANPVLRMKPIVDFMREAGIEKPLMVTEGGISHTIRTEGEDATVWAETQLARMYGELVRTYPQLKLMCYFNVVRSEEANDYALYTNQTISSLYNQLVKDPYFLSDPSVNAGFGYQPFAGGNFTKADVLSLSAAAWFPKVLAGTTEYYVDGTAVAAVTNPPFSLQIPLSNYAIGTHDLLVVYAADGKGLLRKTIPFTVTDTVSVFVNGKKVSFPDQQPVIDEGRTLVPARGVFEKLGMVVSWDGEKQLVTLSGGTMTLTIKIGENTLTRTEKGKSETVTFDVPAKIIGGRTMLPLRAITEAIRGGVKWEESTRSVRLTYQP